MVREELERHYCYDGRQLRACLRNCKRVGDCRCRRLVALGHHADDWRETRAALLHVAERLLLAGYVGEKRDDRRLFGEERDWPVLEFRRLVALCVDIGDFLYLERSLILPLCSFFDGYDDKIT